MHGGFAKVKDTAKKVQGKAYTVGLEAVTGRGVIRRDNERKKIDGCFVAVVSSCHDTQPGHLFEEVREESLSRCVVVLS